MKLAAGVSTYHDKAGLKRLLDSLTEFDYVFVIFGKYPSFAELPDDGSTELVKSYPNTVLKFLDVDEPDKRNAYLELAGQLGAEYLLIIDSDEWVQGNIREFKQNLSKCADSIHGVSYHSPSSGYSDEPRLWYKPHEMEYHGKHNTFRNKATGQIYHSGSAAKTTIEGITIMSDDSLRSREHGIASEQYQAWLRQYEKESPPPQEPVIKKEEPAMMWCYNCKQGTAKYVVGANGVTDCPLCKRGKLTRYKNKIYRVKGEAPPDPKYLELAKSQKFRFAVGVIFYQDKDSLKRTLDSITPHFDQVYCIDGRWRDYPAENDLSTDGSRELVQSYPNTILEDAGGLKQPEKRNRYFELARIHKPDVLVFIDSDEWLKGDFAQWKLEITARCLATKEPSAIGMWVRFTKEEPHQYGWHPRITWQPHRFMLKFDHYTHYDIETGKPIASVNGNRHVTLMHNDLLRSKEWTQKQARHDLWQIIYELQHRYKEKPRVKEHLQKHGYDAVGVLLDQNPELVKLVNEFELKETRPTGEYLANPEYREFGQAVRRWMCS